MVCGRAVFWLKGFIDGAAFFVLLSRYLALVSEGFRLLGVLAQANRAH